MHSQLLPVKSESPALSLAYTRRAVSLVGLCVVSAALAAPLLIFGHTAYILLVPAALTAIAAVCAFDFLGDRSRGGRRGYAQDEGEACYRALFDQANDAIFMLDPDGTYLAVNQQAARLLGYTADELVGANYLAHVPESESAHAENRLSAVRQGEVLPPYERTLVKKDGRQITVEINVAAVRNMQGEVMFIQSIARDVTDRKWAEYQRLELERTNAHMKALREFMSETSHDLRTPISVINTCLYLLRKKLPPEYASLHQFDTLEAQIRQMVRILENLGGVSELDGEVNPFRFGNVNLNTLVGRLIEQYQPLAQQKNQTLRARLAPTKVFVRADDVQLTRAVQNLVINAINYTPNGGTITVSITTDDGHAFLEVSDTGIGISPESLPHIFERFYRADAARPANEGGLGLGLPITHKIIELHGGSIEVESQPGQGSCFRVLLPMPERQPVGEQFI